MSKLSNSHSEFLKQHPLDKSSVIRGLAALMLSAGTGLGVIYVNYHNYWKVTIYRTQTVDFNILANLLPTKVSTHLLKNDKKGLQEALDSNYGLFGIFVTDCKSVKVDCPEQQITYGSKIKIEKISNYQQQLIPEGNYAGVWTKKFTTTDTPSKLLKGSDYVLLRNPPSIDPGWKFESPRDSKIVISQQENTDTIIGRVYFVRGNPPSFIDELVKLNPLKESRNLVYDAIAGSALLTGILAWLLSEMFYYRSRKADRLEIESERALRDAAEQVTQANIDKFNAEKDARLAQSKTDAIAREKDQAQEDARLAQSKAAEIAGRLDAIAEEKDQAQEDARLAQAKTDEIAQAKDKAQEDALIAQAKADETNRRLNNVTKEKLKADRNAEYLRKSINTKNTSYKELEKENEKLKLRISELEASKIDGNLINENTTVKCLTVCEALMCAAENFTILNIWDDAYRNANDMNNSSARRVYTVLEILAKVGDHYLQRTTNNGIIYLLNEEGVQCSGESRQTMEKYGSERIFHHWNEPPKQMEMHIKVGRQLRIYFDVDMENQKIIIGYCGRHLRTPTG